jgi:hypothetical protein
MHKHTIAILGTAAILLAGASDAPAQDLNLNRTAKSGADSPLAYSGRWDRNCNALPVTVTITQKPLNGTATVVDAERVIPQDTPASGDTGKCAGKTITSKRIIYRSKPNFRGNDMVVYETKDGGRLINRTTISVSVQ